MLVFLLSAVMASTSAPTLHQVEEQEGPVVLSVPEDARSEKWSTRPQPSENLYAEGRALHNRGLKEQKTGNMEAAVQLWKDAIERGYWTASISLGHYYTEYLKDDEQAEKLFLEVAKKANTDIKARLLYNLGLIKDRKGNKDAAVKLWKESVKLGYYRPHQSLGLYYMTDKNYTQAVKHFREAAEKGNDDAQYSLGSLFYNGIGVPQSYETAVEWFMKAVQKDQKEAQGALEQTKIPSDVLKNSKSWQVLDLSNAEIEDVSVEILALVLPYFEKLTKLNLSGMKIVDKEKEIISDNIRDTDINTLLPGLLKMPALTTLELNDSNIGEDGKAALATLPASVRVVYHH